MAEMNIPFTVYDIFVFLIPGALVMFSLALLFWPVDDLAEVWKSLDSYGELRFALYGVGLILAYVAGQTVSIFSKVLLEDIIVDRGIGRPSKLLFVKGNDRLFLEYRRSYDKTFIEEFDKTIVEDLGWDAKGEDRFVLCHKVVREKCPVAFSKLSTFMVQYELARNLAMSLLFASLPFLWIGLFEDEDLFAKVGLLCVFLFFMMTLRYLKYFRHYSDEVFTTYLSYVRMMKEEKASPSPADSGGTAGHKSHRKGSTSPHDV